MDRIVIAWCRQIKLWVLGGVLVGSSMGAAAETGLLVIRLDAVQLDSGERETTSGFPLSNVSLEEIRTKKTVSFVAPRRVEVLELEEGTYCVDFIGISRSNSFNFCEEPHIVINAKRITNAGLWRYGVRRDLSSAQRTQAFAFRNEIAQLAEKDFPGLMAKYHAGEDNLLAFTEKPLAQWTDRERQVLREFYTGMPESKSPPLPIEGVASVVSAVRAFAQQGQKLVSKFFVNVNAQGDVVGSTIIDSTSEAATSAGIEAAKSLKFLPAQCKGTPCPMGFPVYLVFR